VKVKAKPPTRAQDLSKALRGCRKEKSKDRRVRCERQARKRFATKTKAKTKAKKATGDRRAE
jgi:hypothetical protein